MAVTCYIRQVRYRLGTCSVLVCSTCLSLRIPTHAYNTPWQATTLSSMIATYLLGLNEQVPLKTGGRAI